MTHPFHIPLSVSHTQPILTELAADVTSLNTVLPCTELLNYTTERYPGESFAVQMFLQFQHFEMLQSFYCFQVLRTATEIDALCWANSHSQTTTAQHQHAVYRIQWNLFTMDTFGPAISGSFLLLYRGFPLSELKMY